jgi:tRNA(fMet)-specific endonuclease VapC
MTIVERFAELRAELFDRGRVIGEMDLLNAAIALVHNLTIVTHNTRDYADVPDLSLIDWLAV